MPISHKKNDKGELSAREQLFQNVPGLGAMEDLMETAADLVFCIKSRHGEYLAANAAFLRRTRLGSFEELYGRTARELFPGPLALGYEQQDARVMTSGKPIRGQLELITNTNGTHGWYLADKVPVRDRDGQIVALAGISRDLRAGAADARLGPLAKAVDRIRRDFASPLRISVLADEAGLSLSRFERLMRSVLNVSPRQLLTRIRVEAAAHALRNTDRSLVDIALDCGYCDQPTFSRQFKTEMGVTPRHHRLSRKHK